MSIRTFFFTVNRLTKNRPNARGQLSRTRDRHFTSRSNPVEKKRKSLPLHCSGSLGCLQMWAVLIFLLGKSFR